MGFGACNHNYNGRRCVARPVLCLAVGGKAPDGSTFYFPTQGNKYIFDTNDLVECILVAVYCGYGRGLYVRTFGVLDCRDATILWR